MTSYKKNDRPSNAPKRCERPSSRAMRRLLRSRSAWLGMLLAGGFVLVALLADVIPPWEVNHRACNDPGRGAISDKVSEANQPPSWQHWLGTDDGAKDTLARLIYGFRLSVMFGLSLTLLSSCIGVAVGAAQGYFG